MPRRLLLLLPVLALGASGCQGDRELQQEFLNYKNDTGYQLEVLNHHDSFLKEKMAETQKEMKQLEASDHDLIRDFNSYSRRPEEIKKEIVEDAAQRAARIEAEEDEFRAEINGKLDAADAHLQQKLDQAANEINGRLESEGAFFDYVMSSQDSVNMVFARRFDSRPWYESVLGKWTEKKPLATPPHPTSN